MRLRSFFPDDPYLTHKNCNLVLANDLIGSFARVWKWLGGEFSPWLGGDVDVHGDCNNDPSATLV
jgi:hypothetical protein